MSKFNPYIVILLASPFFVAGQGIQNNAGRIANDANKINNKMTVEIWSDVVCPFCYIGKRKFELALEKFSRKDAVEIVWKSFQLDPGAPAEGTDYLKDLSERKGWSLDQTKGITDNVRAMAAEVGLTYHFEKAVSANSLDAHRLSHLALKNGLQDAIEEGLFKAHFTEGKNIADRKVLVQLGTAAGLDSTEVAQMLEEGSFSDAVQHDIQEARALGIQGVPFFVIDRKYAVSGAQSPEVFLSTLEKALKTWEEGQK